MLRRNILANAVGQAWAALLMLVSIPVYIALLGVEAYGLVALFSSLHAMLVVLDLGLGTTANREVARRLRDPGRVDGMLDLVRTLEIVYIAVGAALAISLGISARWLHTLITAEHLAPRTLYLAVVVFAVSVGVRWPIALYSGVLLGAERQVRLNVITTVLATLRVGGAILVLAFVAPSILAFLIWQLGMAVVEFVTMAATAWLILPRTGHRPRFRVQPLREVWRFSAAVGGNSVLAAVLKQADRLLVTKLMPLRFLGYYSAAHSAALGLSMLTRPIATAALPRFAALHGTGNEQALAAAYHRLSRLVAALVAPAAAVLMFFPRDILLLWTRSADVASAAAPTFAVFAFANLLNSMMQVPFVLQLAAGITWIAFWNNAISLIFLLPLMYVLIGRFGIAGAGVSWAIFNFAYFLIVPHIAHRYVLRGHVGRWYLRDTLPYIVAALAITGGVWFLRNSGVSVALVTLAAAAGVLLYILLVVVSGVLRHSDPSDSQTAESGNVPRLDRTQLELT